MNTPIKVGSYLAGLVAVFAAAVGIGSAVGPLGPAGDQPSPPAQTHISHTGMDTGGDAGS
ncbi:hypothetical protein GCU67_04195 [Modestobacter muralis]|uniref:Uncharacterized protein n=1 Tax=Modestobacter muralis TaxID=1608614 RepID=A0A6P0ENV3_9ACTN|nr:hypothetical protein [Modestobacter muralis]NEK93381.1 hypothetical protein [Modestobacter muralis]NEN50148.1 hypothetical protein [Modestobacter muralis]